MRRWCVLTLAMLTAGALIGCANSSTPTATTTAGPANTAPPPSASASAGSTQGSAPGTTSTSGTPAATGTDEFCRQMKKANDASTSSSSAKVPSQADIDGFIGSLEKARDAGPPELKEPLAKLIETYKKFIPIMNDPSKQSEAMAIFFDDQVTAANQKVREVVKQGCGIDLNRGSGSSSTTSAGSVPPSNSAPSSGASPCRDITNTSETDGKPTSLYSVKKAVCTANLGASWGSAIFSSASWSFTNDGDNMKWEVSVYTDKAPPATLDPADALIVCAAISGYLASVGQADAEITIGTSTSTESINGPSKVLAMKPSKGACGLS